MIKPKCLFIRLLSVFVILCIAFNLASCNNNQNNNNKTSAEDGCSHDFSEKKTTAEYFAADSKQNRAAKYYYSCKNCGAASTETFEYGRKDSERAAVGSNAKTALDGKKVLIVGCSYNYKGKTVMAVHQPDLSYRANDKGYFYELCKQNGADVNVTNWCFGHHDLKDLLSTNCASGRCGNNTNHLAELTDRNYDYVSLMDIARPDTLSLEEYINELKGYMKLFTDVNPDCKFIYSIPCGAYWYKNADRENFKETYIGTVYAKEIAKLDNVIVLDWGRMIYDVIKGTATVPNSKLTYNANSFIIADGYHPNLLTGYMNALMTYCAITGETAVGQPIDLENGEETGEAMVYKLFSYVSNWYEGKTTNFTEILSSEKEMKKVQKLVDRYLDMDTYLYY